jgi:acyl carrier protein
MSFINDVQDILVATLNLSGSTQLAADTPLLGAIPEFDSMAVVAIITVLEDRFGFAIEDDEIGADVFETVGSLLAFVEQKMG